MAPALSIYFRKAWRTSTNQTNSKPSCPEENFVCNALNTARSGPAGAKLRLELIQLSVFPPALAIGGIFLKPAIKPVYCRSQFRLGLVQVVLGQGVELGLGRPGSRRQRRIRPICQYASC